MRSLGDAQRHAVHYARHTTLLSNQLSKICLDPNAVAVNTATATSALSPSLGQRRGHLATSFDDEPAQGNAEIRPRTRQLERSRASRISVRQSRQE